MFTVNYDFQPKDTVFVVIDGTRIEKGKVLTVKIKTYVNDVPLLVTTITYSVLLSDSGEGTVTLDASLVFGTLQEAADYVAGYLTPTPTPTLTATVTPTISITPTISTTPDITPTVTPTLTVTPTVTGTAAITPTVTPTATVTPPPTVTPSVTPVIQALYILEDNGPIDSIVSQHTLGTINVMSTAAPDNASYNVTTQAKKPSGLFIDTSGTRMFILDRDTLTLYRYNLVIARDVYSAVYTGDSYTFEESTHNVIKEIAFNPTGDRLYVIRDQGDDEIHQHDLGIAWDLSTVGIAYGVLLITPERVANGFYFGDGGSKLYLCGDSTLHIFQYDLSVAYDITTALISQSLSVDIASYMIEGVSLSASGSEMFVYVDGHFRTYSLPAPWTITNAIMQGEVGTYSPAGIGQGRSFNLQLF